MAALPRETDGWHLGWIALMRRHPSCKVSPLVAKQLDLLPNPFPNLRLFLCTAGVSWQRNSTAPRRDLGAEEHGHRRTG